MGVSEPPYIYDQPQHNRNIIAYPYSQFDPKAVTAASYAAASQQSLPKPKQNGPLLNFNQHPDSYMIVTGQDVSHEPMPANTKKTVTVLRWVLFVFRIFQEVRIPIYSGFRYVVIGNERSNTNTDNLPQQAWDSVVTLYAIVHLIRPAKARTPSSSYSYHFFALFMDVGLIPFYVFVTMVTNSQYTKSLEASTQAADDAWSSFFSSPVTTTLLLTIWILAIALGSLHLVTAGFDVALILIFRKIAHLPPDMNPLEENLTGRRAFNPKHKHKNSEYTLNSENSMTDAEKKMAHMSTSTFSVINQSRNSVTDKDAINDSRSVPFRHSRTGSTADLAFSPHNPETARWSRHQYDGQQNLYREAANSPRSRYEIGPSGKLEVRTRRPRPRSNSPTKRNPAMAPTTPTTPYHSVPRDQEPQFNVQPATPDHFSPTPTRVTTQDQQKESLLKDNWYATGQDDEEADLGSPVRRSRNGYQPVHDRHDSAFETVGSDMFGEHTEIKPLGMNPPTPPPQAEEHFPDPDEASNQQGVSRTLTAASHNTITSSVYSESAPSLTAMTKGAGTPKGKYYGDLAAATLGVRGTSPVPAPNYSLPAKSRSPAPAHANDGSGSARVVSRSGADILDEAGPYGSAAQTQRGGYGIRSRRDVSGKVAEEGRGGVQRTDWVEDTYYRKGSARLIVMGMGCQMVNERRQRGKRGDGHVNVSPKGGKDFGIIDEKTFWYLDLSGSGNETISHLLEPGNGRITIQFCAFDGPPKIVRFWGKGACCHGPDHVDFVKANSITLLPGTRSIIVVDIHQVGSSCGFSVPYYDFKDFRQTLTDLWVKRAREVEDGKSESAMPRYVTRFTSFHSISEAPPHKLCPDTQNSPFPLIRLWSLPLTRSNVATGRTRMRILSTVYLAFRRALPRLKAKPSRRSRKWSGRFDLETETLIARDPSIYRETSCSSSSESCLEC
nr:pyridoxamine 5'-phosphate oxidase family protein usto [Quercus suber]